MASQLQTPDPIESLGQIFLTQHDINDYYWMLRNGPIGDPALKGLHQVLGDTFEEDPGQLFHGFLVKCYSHGQNKFTPYPVHRVRQAEDGMGLEVELHIQRRPGQFNLVPVKLEQVWPLHSQPGANLTITENDGNYMRAVIKQLDTPAAFFIANPNILTAKKRLFQSLAALARVRHQEEECDRQAGAIATLEQQLTAKRRELSGPRMHPVTGIYGMPTERDKQAIMEEIERLEDRIKAASARLKETDPGRDTEKHQMDQVFHAVQQLRRAMLVAAPLPWAIELQMTSSGVQLGQDPRSAWPRVPLDDRREGGGSSVQGIGAEPWRSQPQGYSELQLKYLDLCSEQLEFHRQHGSLSGDGSEVLWDRVPQYTLEWLRQHTECVRAVRDQLQAANQQLPSEVECVQHSLRRAVQGRSKVGPAPAAEPTLTEAAAHHGAGAVSQLQHARPRQGPPQQPQMYVSPPGVKWTGLIGLDARGKTFETLMSASIWCAPLQRELGPATGRSSRKAGDPTQCNRGAFASMEALHNMKLVITKECTEQMSRIEARVLEQRVLVDMHLVPEVGMLCFSDPVELRRFIQFGRGQGWYSGDNEKGVALGSSASLLHDGPLRGYKLTVHVFTCASRWACQRLASALPEEQRSFFLQDKAFIIIVRLKPPITVEPQGRSQRPGSMGPAAAAAAATTVPAQYPPHAWAAVAHAEKPPPAQPAAVLSGEPPPPPGVATSPTPWAHPGQARAPGGPTVYWGSQPYAPASGAPTKPLGAVSKSADYGALPAMQPTLAGKGSDKLQTQFSSPATFVPYSAAGLSQPQAAASTAAMGSGPYSDRPTSAPPWRPVTRVDSQVTAPETQQAGAALPGGVCQSHAAWVPPIGVPPITHVTQAAAPSLRDVGGVAGTTAPTGDDARVQLSWRSAAQVFRAGIVADEEMGQEIDVELQQEQWQGAPQQQQEPCLPASPKFALSSDDEDE